MKTYEKTRMRAAVAGLVVAVFGVSGCGDLLEVTNAGLIEDESLNDPTFAPAIVAGMSADYSRALNPGIAQFVSVSAFEIRSGLSDQGEHVIGYLDHDTSDRQTTWDSWQRARWVASAGVERLKESLSNYGSNSHAASANLYAGLTNRLLGENACHAVIDGGSAQPRETHFTVGEAYFTEAAQIAQAAGNDDVYHAALGGRASVRAWQGNWSGAVADASMVPPGFVFYAPYSSAGVQLRMWEEQFNSRYLTMMGSMWAPMEPLSTELPDNWEADFVFDPRTPWSMTWFDPNPLFAPRTRGGGWRAWPQTKYTTRDDDVPVTHGAEMLVLRAEAALRAGDLAGMTTLLNESRALWDMDPLPQPASEAEAWEVFKFERVATVWLEHRGFWDRARWYAEGRDNLLEGRAQCFPIGRREIDSNSNLTDFR